VEGDDVTMFHEGLNPYDFCPELETDYFRLRLVRESDAEDLLLCYSDPHVHCILNSDNCTSDFKYSTVNEMLDCIRFWLNEYQERGFVRWSIVDRDSGKAAGTIEMFGDRDKWGILRVDVAANYEERALLSELFGLAKRHFFTLFKVDTILTKAVPEAIERIAALQDSGYIPTEAAGREHYYICT